jgi:hypothetical protein
MGCSEVNFTFITPRLGFEVLFKGTEFRLSSFLTLTGTQFQQTYLLLEGYALRFCFIDIPWSLGFKVLF